MKKLILLSILLPLIAMANFSIGDKVWNDKNQDWEQGLDEKGYSNVTVTLFDENGKKIKSMVTNTNGKYLFSNLPEGEYAVNITPPTGVSLVTEAPIELWLEENRHDINFGIFKATTYSIAGNIWNDKNKDWEMGAIEPKVANVTVELYSSTGKKVATTKTDTKGNYKFSKLTEGEYSVKVIETQSLKIVTESPLELWIENNIKGVNFGVNTKEVSNPPITIAKLREMIKNDEDVTNVNTSEITDMYALFRGRSNFNQDISGWDVSNVTNMSSMFEGAKSFNQDIGRWDVSKVTNMREMFYRAFSFNQNINDWNISSVTSLSLMFYYATDYNQPLDKWDTSNVAFMNKLFFFAKSFNQPIDSWDVGNVDTMESMFEGAEAFDQPLNDWHVYSVKNMSEMFDGAKSFNQPLDKWDVSTVTNMYRMFVSAASFNQPLNSWNTINVKTMQRMFWSTKSFNQPLNNWNVTNVTNWKDIFTDAIAMEEVNKPSKFR